MSDPHGPPHPPASSSGPSFFGPWFLAAAIVVGAVYLAYALTWLYA
ncbi:MAG TPA: hypothetical protein VNM43_08890 [Dehalococcoidia bacterium]|nr:hypothetical protein [Dehalococcoidia bacterium]